MADRSTRFRGVEWETPMVTFESLKQCGCPLDISAIQCKVEAYTSVVSEHILYSAAL